MAWRVIIRFSFESDTGSALRNQIAGILNGAGIRNTTTGTWEKVAADPVDAAQVIGRVMTMIAGVAPPTALDHIWIYIDDAP